MRPRTPQALARRYVLLILLLTLWSLCTTDPAWFLLQAGVGSLSVIGALFHVIRAAQDSKEREMLEQFVDRALKDDQSS